MTSYEKDLLSPLGIYFEIIDNSGNIIPSRHQFWNWAGIDMPEEPVDMYEVFYELVGREQEINELLLANTSDTDAKAVQVMGIKRGNRYVNLSVLPGTIVLQDVSDEMRDKLAVVQAKNNAAILEEQLKERNTQLEKANLKLDDFLRTIRSHNHDLDIKVKQRTSELYKSRLSVISMLARVAEFRDTDTGMHTFRIGQSSVMIGRLLNMDDRPSEHLFYASLLHDIGKIGIPDSILLKPGRLSPEENTIMKTHTTIGAEILDKQGHPIFETARQVALSHHERWDGKGYPQGLAGKEIPIVGRICAVVDVFDALISKRPYKEAWPVERALEEIKALSGSHFDPEVVEAFFQVAPDIVQLHHSNELEDRLPPELEGM